MTLEEKEKEKKKIKAKIYQQKKRLEEKIKIETLQKLYFLLWSRLNKQLNFEKLQKEHDDILEKQRAILVKSIDTEVVSDQRYAVAQKLLKLLPDTTESEDAP